MEIKKSSFNAILSVTVSLKSYFLKLSEDICPMQYSYFNLFPIKIHMFQ